MAWVFVTASSATPSAARPAATDVDDIWLCRASTLVLRAFIRLWSVFDINGIRENNVESILKEL
jgi:hypothetical protein